MSKKHPGFEKASHDIAKKQHIPEKNADAILAASSRKNKATSPNKALKKVKG